MSVQILSSNYPATANPLPSNQQSPQKAASMPFSQMSCFDANLPGATKGVRIASFYDAKMFVRRWVIRDRDPALKALLRKMERVKNCATGADAIQELQQALSLRGLLGAAGQEAQWKW